MELSVRVRVRWGARPGGIQCEIESMLRLRAWRVRETKCSRQGTPIYSHFSLTPSGQVPQTTLPISLSQPVRAPQPTLSHNESRRPGTSIYSPFHTEPHGPGASSYSPSHCVSRTERLNLQSLCLAGHIPQSTLLLSLTPRARRLNILSLSH